MRRIWKTRLAAAITGVGALVASLGVLRAGQELRQEFHQTYSLTPNGRVGLENVNGAVHIVAWDRTEVKVDAIKTARSQEQLDDAKIQVDAKPDSIRIQTRYPESSGFWSRHREPASVEYTITVPRGARLDKVELVNGSLDIDGVSNDIVAATVNGNVHVKSLRGNAKLSTVNGKLMASVGSIDPSKDVHLESVNGSIEITLPPQPRVKIKASTLNGDIRNDFGLRISREGFVGKELDGVVGSGGALLRLENVNGSITIGKRGTV